MIDEKEIEMNGQKEKYQLEMEKIRNEGKSKDRIIEAKEEQIYQYQQQNNNLDESIEKI